MLWNMLIAYLTFALPATVAIYCAMVVGRQVERRDL